MIFLLEMGNSDLYFGIYTVLGLKIFVDYVQHRIITLIYSLKTFNTYFWYI